MEVTYEEFIQNILETRGRFECGDEYCERHHIIARCMGGTDEEDNLIDLFAREHFEAHRLLAIENPENDKLIYAWNMMCNCRHGDYQITAEEYEESRIAFSKMLSKTKVGKNNPMYGIPSPNKGKPVSKETRKKQSDAKKGKYNGENHPFYGKHHTEESKRKNSESHKGLHTGENHCSARKVIRLSDLVIYGYLNKAAQENNMNRATMRKKCKEHKGFMYYDEWIIQKNN